MAIIYMQIVGHLAQELEISAIFSPSIGVNTGSWDLVVEDYQFGDIILPNAITINASPPIINFLTPTVASPGESHTYLQSVDIILVLPVIVALMHPFIFSHIATLYILILLTF